MRGGAADAAGAGVDVVDEVDVVVALLRAMVRGVAE